LLANQQDLSAKVGDNLDEDAKMDVRAHEAKPNKELGF
jgi:hypothetical protein